MQQDLFTNKALKKLIWPLLLEQLLALTVGLMDTVMVSSLGETAVSGVSLVDMINVLFLNVFAALGTGGAVVAAQLLGAKDRRRACVSAGQLYFVVTIISLTLSAVLLAVRAPLLRLLFGAVEDSVMRSALTYFTISIFSFPLLAIYNAGASLFRAQGNSRVSMLIAALVNAVNIIGNALMIYGLHQGVAGAALASLFARGVAAVAITVLLLDPAHTVSLRCGKAFRPDGALIGRILSIGIPNSLENSLFQLGRVLVVSMITLFGTTQIAANAVANNLDSIGILPGQAINLAMITVVGQCVGAGDAQQVRRMAKKLLRITYAALGATCLATCLLCPLILRAYQLSADSLALALALVLIHCLCAIPLWPPSFTLPNALRAAGDVRFPMVCAIASMALLRLGGGYVLSVQLQLGAIGIWIAMVADWICRTVCFSLRFRSSKWLTFAPTLRRAQT